MIFKENPVKIGYISKAHGVHGGLLVVTDQSFQDEQTWPKWIFIDIEGGLVPFLCEQEDCFQKDDHSLVLFLRGKQKSELVTELIDHDVYFPGEFVSNDNEIRWTPSGLIGFKVQIEDSGLAGEISDWVDIPGNPLLVVTWNNRELLIPAHNEFIKAIDYDSKALVITPPEGLISL